MSSVQHLLLDLHLHGGSNVHANLFDEYLAIGNFPTPLTPEQFQEYMPIGPLSPLGALIRESSLRPIFNEVENLEVGIEKGPRRIAPGAVFD